MCYTPITLVNKKETVHTRNGSITNVVPCGKCPECLRRRQASWAFRLQQEQMQSTTACFLTTTYEDESLPFTENGLMTLETKDHQAFIKRLRTRISRDKTLTPNRQPIKYYGCGEYGGQTHRPHFHYIMFNLPMSYIEKQHQIIDEWQNGNIFIAENNIKTINYVTGYIMKKAWSEKVHSMDDRKKETSFMSKGLGKTYLTKNKKAFYKKKMQPYMTVENGHKKAFPRYYRDKIFTEAERRKLGIESKIYAEENYPYTDAKHEIEYVQNRLDKYKRENQPKRLTI